jgi:hypothetical protein
MWYAVLTFKDYIIRSDFTRSFTQFQHHNITSDKLSDQNNERFYQVKQTVENRKPSIMGDVATLLFVHFNFIIQLRNMFLFLKSIHIAYFFTFGADLTTVSPVLFKYCCKYCYSDSRKLWAVMKGEVWRFKIWFNPPFL